MNWMRACIFTVCVILVFLLTSSNGQINRPKLYEPGVPTYVWSPANYDYTSAWYTVEDRTSITFDVQACSDAYIALTEYSNDIEDATIEITLGDRENQQSRINSDLIGVDFFMASTPDILHCNEYRSFWISWKDNNIEVGYGPVVGLTKFMNYKDESGHKINAFGVKTGYTSTGLWKFSENTGDIVRIYTTDTFQLGQFWKIITRRQSLIFDVTAKAEAHILLSSDLGDTNEDSSYRISIGANENTISGISQGPYSAWSVKVQTNNILSSIDERTFWISWYQGLIKVGRGGLVDSNTFMVYKDNKTIPIKAAAITTAQGSTGSWRFKETLEPENYVYTIPNSDREYNQFWIEAPKKQAIKFSVAACSDASIVLCTRKEDLTDDSIEVVLNNTKSAIKFPFEVGNIVEVETPNQLSCLDSRDFWITWTNNTLKVGLGLIYGQETQMHFVGLDHVINAAGITTSNKKEGYWTIPEDSGERVAVQTPNSYTYNFWRSVKREFFTAFKVRACNDAHILLSNNRGRNATLIYEIVLGGWANQKSAIRDMLHGKQLTVQSTPSLMNCTRSRNFWISWDGTDIAVGRGKIYGLDQFMSVFKTSWFKVNFFSISTGWGATGEWRFDEDVGDTYTLYTGQIKEYGQNWLQLRPGTTSVSFDVQACSDAHVLLAVDKDKLQSDVIEIVIGGVQNSQSEIRLQMGGEPIKTVNVKDLLDCNVQNRFWVSWAGGLLQVGKSHTFGHNKFMEYKNQLVLNIGYASFSTGGISAGWWSVREFLGLQWTLRTTEMPGRIQQNIWRSVEHRRSVVFSVKGCRDVKVVMTAAMEFLTQARYVLIIGGWKNTMSAFRRRGTPYEPIVARRNTPNILDCDNFRDFWLAWYNGVLTFGKGKLVGRNKVMDYDDLAPSPIRALQFKTPLRVTAQWIFPSDGLIPPDPPVTPMPPPTKFPPGPVDQNGYSPGQKAGIAFSVIGFLVVVALLIAFIPSRLQRFKHRSNTQENHVRIQLPPMMMSSMESRINEK